MATPTPVTLDELTAAKGKAQAMAESLGLSPGSIKIMVASALGTFAGSALAAQAPAAAAVTSTRVGKQPVRPEPPAMAGESSSASEPLGLKGRPRGSQVLVQVAAEYGARKVYTFSDVCALATRIMAGTLMVADLQQKNSDGAWTFGIPRSTMLDKWLKDDHSVMQSQNPPRLGLAGSPHWLVERDVRGRTELSKPGPGTVMGAAETQLMHTLATAAKKGWAYMEEEIDDLVRNTCIELEVLDPRTKTLYSETSNVNTLVKNFLNRCEEKGIVFIYSNGRKLGLQRAIKSNWEALDHYGRIVATPALVAFQRRHDVKLTLLDVGNFDEAQVDLCDFAEKGMFLILPSHGKNIVVPFEQCPHFTIKWGFIGTQLMVSMLIKIGSDETAPHPHHCQLLQSSRVIVLAQSVNGWTNTTLTTAFLQLQYDDPIIELGPTSAPAPAAAATATAMPVDDEPDGAAGDALRAAIRARGEAQLAAEAAAGGDGGAAAAAAAGGCGAAAPAAGAGARLPARPKVLNFDGHSAHLYNEALKDGFTANKILGLCPCSHTSAPTQQLPGTQQADYGAKHGGGIASLKGKLRPMLCKQFRASLMRAPGDPKRGKIDVAELLAMCEKALLVSWDGSMAEHLNEQVGYYVDPTDGFLKLDVLRMHRAEVPVDGTVRKRTSADVLKEMKDKEAKAIEKARLEMNAAGAAVAMQNKAVVDRPDKEVRKVRKDAPNKFGCVVSREESIMQTALDVAAAATAAAKDADKENKAWPADRRKAIRGLEEILEQKGTPSKLAVGQLKQLIFSRTGHHPHAKNNKTEEGEEEGAMLREARAAMAKQPTSLCPPSPAAAPATAMEEDEEDNSEDEDEDGMGE